MFDIFIHSSLSQNTFIYNASWAFQWSHGFLYEPLKCYVNLSINRPINTLLIENLAFGKYKVAF